MLYYVSHKYGGDAANFERAKDITHELAKKDTSNTYICPVLALSHFEYGEIGYEEEIEQCIDILSLCDKLIVASDISAGVAKEIEMARLFGMEVEFVK